MKLSDYTIDHSCIDWPRVLQDWRWLVPSRLTVWVMNQFGDLFVTLDDGTVHMLDVGGGTFNEVAKNCDDFAQKIDDEDHANQWLMIPLIDKLVASRVTLSKGKCYGYCIPPVLGGDYTLENTFVISIPEHFSFHASIHQQIKDVPDGTQVTIEVQDGE